MHVLAAKRARSATIHPVRLNAEIALDGMAAQQVDDLLHGRGLHELWRPGLRVSLDNRTAAIEGEKSTAREHDLADGRVSLCSGQPGTLTVETRHGLDNTLIPQSLNLLMAQQLARSGLMMVHGAALRIDGLGILALGARGSGKSVLAASALAAGAEIVSDDWLLVGRAEDGRFHAERLRQFLMLRHGWAADRLLEALAGLGGRIAPGRVKTVLEIEQQPEAVQQRFPASIALDRGWLLDRPRCGRTADSTIVRCSQAEALAGLIAATMPLLFGGDFPIESRALTASARGLIADLDWNGIRTGLDLVDDPRSALSSLVVASAR